MTPDRLILAAALLVLPGCTANPRNEIAAIAAAALADARVTSPGQIACVDRTITRWRPAAEAGRIDPPAPPGFAALYADKAFRGGGGLAGASAGGIAIGAGAGCVQLHGPLVSGDRAMIELRVGRTGWNLWLHRVAPDWRVVMTTTSVYAR